jgi:hypothetical protein
LILESDFFWTWWGVVFVGVFEKIGCLDVVILWCGCGDLRGGGGVLDVVFSGRRRYAMFLRFIFAG